MADTDFTYKMYLQILDELNYKGNVFSYISIFDIK